MKGNEDTSLECSICKGVIRELRNWRNNHKKQYLPDELINEVTLRLCHTCYQYVTSRKRKCPPNAYWVRSVPDNPTADQGNVDSSLECSICKDVIRELKNWRNNHKKKYLPDELINEDTLHLCHTCYQYVTGRKRKCPPNAYWVRSVPDIPNADQGKENTARFKCDICHIGMSESKTWRNTGKKNYLPSELLQRSVLCLCSACHAYISSRKRKFPPPNSYWIGPTGTSADCGTIPPVEPQEHTQRMLSVDEQYQAQMVEFENLINQLPNRICEICQKRCYEYQTKILNNVPSYLPEELLMKKALLLCHRCSALATAGKKLPKAYWNNLDPGVIPRELEVLTQAEQRLLSRIVPFVKVVKLSGRFGQYGFKGQAVLFAHDIFEITERLPQMLPRSTDNASFVVVTENLENLNVTRQFTISRDNVYAALKWLIKHNPLYADVTIDEDANLDQDKLVRVVSPDEPPQILSITVPQNTFKSISDSSRILRASWHQADDRIFSTSTRGAQCCAMAVASILRAVVLPPAQWDKNIVDQNLIVGDELYRTVRAQSDDIPPSGYLLLKNFDVIKNGLFAFNSKFTIVYEDNAPIFGSLLDNLNAENIGCTLQDGLQSLFQHHCSGVLTAKGKSYALMKADDKYYFSDSHSCGPKGASAANGTACIIECDSMVELHRIVRRATGSKSGEQFTIDFVDVECSDVAMAPTQQTTVPFQDEPTIARMTVDATVGLQDEPTSTRMNVDVADDMIPIHTTVMTPIDAIQPDVEEELEFGQNPNEIRRKTTENIVNEAHELKAEEFAWYFLFPYGKNGLKERRKVNISPLDYYQSRILGEDTRFQTNDYLFYALSMYEYYKVKSTITACAKKIEGKKGAVEDVHLYLKNLRGTQSYWNSSKNDLIGMIRCLGPPTYFVTFSCNDLHWRDMKRALLVADDRPDEDPDNLDTFSSQRLVERYPAVISRHFNVRVRAMMKIIKEHDTIFHGPVQDFWWRIEFQDRGSPHLHMLIWVQNHPPFDTPEGIEAINRVCSCQMPDETTPLHRLVNACQIHHHTATCRKNTTAYCRFYFPRPANNETRIIEHTSEEFVRCGGRICLLKRDEQSTWVNNYNPTLLRLWQGNMDIQPCGSNEAIAYYVAKYIAKPEPVQMNRDLATAIEYFKREDTETSRKIFKICMRILKERQVSACECVYRLAHLLMRSSSRECVFLNTRKPDQRYRVLKFNTEGKATGYCDNVFERYEKRPYSSEHFDFDNMSILEFVMLFKSYYTKKMEDKNEDGSDDDETDDQPQKLKADTIITLLDGMKMKKRTKSAVVRVPYFTVTNDAENFYYSLLVQYLPFRAESDLLVGFASAKDAFAANEDNLKETSRYMKLYRDRDKQLEAAFNQMHALEMLETFPAPDDSDEVIEEINLEDLNLSDEDFTRACHSMNIAQRDLFKLFTNHIRQELEGVCTDHKLRLFITGGAGTGKTFLLRTLLTQINKCYGKQSVKVCALTGVAALLVNGPTFPHN